MAVDDLKAFHEANLDQNKHHYTMFVRFTHGKVLNLVQKNGAKIHFNEIELPSELVQNDSEDQIVSSFLPLSISNSIFGTELLACKTW
jgi:hypothetical protein